MLVPKRVKHRREFRGKTSANMVWKHWNPIGSPTARSKQRVLQ